MSFPKAAFWLGSFGIVASCAGFAQQNPPAFQPVPQPAMPYRSALDGYRPYADQNVAPWTASNEAVRAAGGWRAYARQAQAASKPSATPTAPAASAPHGSHPH